MPANVVAMRPTTDTESATSAVVFGEMGLGFEP